MTHTCHIPECKIPVRPALLMCSHHWRMVPANLKRRIWQTYRRGQEVDKNPSAEWLVAAKAAIAAVQKKEMG